MRIALLSNHYHELFDVIESGAHQVVAVIDQGSQKENVIVRLKNLINSILGRHYSIKQWAQKHSIPYFIYSPKLHESKRFQELAPEILIVHNANYLEMPFIDSFPRGSINIHPSLLPDYRGASPLFWQAYDGVDALSVSLHRFTETFDKGDILYQLSVANPQGETEAVQFKKIRQTLAIDALNEVLGDLDHYLSNAKQQPDKTTSRYARYVNSRNIDEIIDLTQLDPEQLYRLINYTRDWNKPVINLLGKSFYLSWRAVEQSETSLVEGWKIKRQLFPYSLSLQYKDSEIILKPSLHLGPLLNRLVSR